MLWVIQMVDQLSILLTHPLCYTKNTFLIANDRAHDIATNKFQEAFDLFDDHISILCKFKCGTDMISSCPLLQVDKLKYPKTKHNKLLKCTTTTDLSGYSASDTKKPV